MRNAISVLLIGLLLTSCGSEKQNFVVIIVDDLGWNDVGYAGSTFYETPNIDQLSEVSVRFTDAYASGSVCSPSRAAIMTGRHPARVNITDWIPGSNPKNEKLIGPNDFNQLPLAEETIAEQLRENGYKTFFAGKWHLGGEGFLPENQGFETNIGGNHHGQPPGGYYSPYKNSNLTDGPDDEYLTDRLTDESISFINQTTSDPFLLLLSYYTVHTPIQNCKRHIDKFNQKLENLKNKQTRKRDEGNGVTTLDQNNPAYASMIYALDENIGRLISNLKERGLYESTTIIFTSDNGGLTTLKKQYNRTAPTSVEPLRAGKGWLYEGGIRVPLLIKPSNYKSGKRTSSQPVVGHDLYPTILSMAGIKRVNASKIDGIDLSPILNNEGNLKREDMFWHYPHYHGSAWTPGAAIRQGDWKLIEYYETGAMELYQLSDDISEQNDVASLNPEKVKKLKERLHYLQKSMNAKEATINPDFAKIETSN